MTFSVLIYLFTYLGFYVAFNTVQVISRRVVGRAEETSTYSSSGFCTVNCRPTASNYQLSPLEVGLGTEPRPQRWEARVLALCHLAPGWQFTVQNLDQLYILLSSSHKTTSHDITFSVLKVAS